MNPYKRGGFVDGERFYGRGLLIRSLLQPDSGLIWLVGNRMVGKTSVLRQLQLLGNKSRRFVALFLDFAATETMSDWTECLRGAAWNRYGRDTLREAQIDLSDCEGLDFFGLQRALTAKSKQRGRELLLLCDEVEAWISAAKKNPRLIQRLRKEWTLLANIKVIIAATQRLWQLHQYDTSPTSPLLIQFSPHYVAQLEDEEANELIEQTNNPLGKVSVSPDLRERIKSYTGNYPFLIQNLCYKLYQEDRRVLRNITADDLVVE